MKVLRWLRNVTVPYSMPKSPSAASGSVDGKANGAAGGQCCHFKAGTTTWASVDLPPDHHRGDRLALAVTGVGPFKAVEGTDFEFVEGEGNKPD